MVIVNLFFYEILLLTFFIPDSDVDFFTSKF